MLKTILGLLRNKPTRAGNHSILLAPLQQAALRAGRNASSETLVGPTTPRCPSLSPLVDKTLAQPENNTRATTKPGCAEVCLVPHSGAFAKGHFSV